MKVETKQRSIADKLEKYLNPKYGKVVFFAGGKGRGKTHELTNYLHHMTSDIGWNICCNIQFDSKTNRNTPPKTNFVKKFSQFWKTYADIREQYGPVPVIPVFDEFHTTVNRLESHKYYNVVTALMSWLSQIRKFNQSALFCTQYLIQIPKDPRMYADHFIVKNKRIAKNMRLNQRKLGDDDEHVRYFSQVVDLEDGEAKILDTYDNVKYIKAHKFRKRHLSKDLELIIENKIVSDFLASTSCSWNDPSRGKYQYKSEGVSTLEFDEIQGDGCQWFSYLLRDLGEADMKGKTLYEAIRDFFDRYESDDSEFKYSLKDFSRAELAKFIYESSDMTLKECGNMFGIKKQTVHQTEIGQERYYWLSKNFLKKDIEESADSALESQNIVSKSAPPPYTNNKKEKQKKSSSLIHEG